MRSLLFIGSFYLCPSNQHILVRAIPSCFRLVKMCLCQVRVATHSWFTVLPKKGQSSRIVENGTLRIVFVTKRGATGGYVQFHNMTLPNLYFLPKANKMIRSSAMRCHVINSCTLFV
jgi:hypothetical protein